MTSKSTFKSIAFLSISAALVLLVLPTWTMAATIQLSKGTEAKVKFAADMQINSGKVAKDVPLLITLAEPIMIGSKTLVEAGAQGSAKVVEVEKAGGGGKPGYIKVEFVDLEVKGAYKSPDGAKIKLTGQLENKGKSKKTLSYIFIAGLFIKGGQGKIDTSQIYTAKVAETLVLEGE